MSKLLQIAGVVALLGWTGAGLAAWMLTKEQVHVTIEDGAGAARATDDPIAALDDRVTTLQEDLRALTRALGENLQALDDSQTNAADARDAALRQRVDAGFAALGARPDGAAETRALRAELAALAREVAGVREQLAAGAVAPAEPATEPRVAVEPERPPVATPPETEPEPTPAPAAEPEQPPATPPRKRSFLAFSLPSDEFSFDGVRSWEVVPSLSRVGFDAKSTLHDFSGVTSKITATLVADLAHPERAPHGSIHVDAASLDTGLADRDTAMREHLGTDAHREIEFDWTAFEPGEVDRDAMRVTGTARGRMRIHGVEHDVAMPVVMTVDESRRLRVDGEMPLRMTDYGVEVPSKLGLISVDENVRVWIALRARPAATKKEAPER